MVKQVEHNMRGSGPRQYWKDMGSIASFIENSLSVPSHTIRVHQAKEKFGAIRVYCTLADPEKIIKRNENREFISGKQQQPLTEMYCFQLDAMWYRSVYMMMVGLVPHYKNVITSQADYPELLLDDKASFDVYFIDVIMKRVQFCLERYSCSTNNELYNFLSSVYEK